MQPKYDVPRLIASVTRTHEWPETSHIDISGVTHGYQSAPLWLNRTGYTPDGEYWQWVLEDFQPLRDARVTRLWPGGYIRDHTDNGPYYERWQIPIIVEGEFHEYEYEDDDEPRNVIQHPGVPWRVHHHRRHGLSVPEAAEGARIILLIDREVPLGFDGDYAVWT